VEAIVTIFGIPLSTSLAFLVTGASIVIAIVWAIHDMKKED
jgi:hypothetical protein